MITLARNVFQRWAVICFLLVATLCRADIIWSDLGATLAHDTGPGRDILGGAVKRDKKSSDTLYFKFHVKPGSDAGTEPYLAAFELYEGDKERLAVGNALQAWAYGVFNVSEVGKTNFNVFETARTNNASTDYGIDLNSSKPAERPEGGFYDYELVRHGIERTIVFKVQYKPGDNDLVTVWLDPDLGPGATEASQMDNLTTKFFANAAFNQIRLRHEGGGEGWTFSEMAIATSFSDFVVDDGGSGLPLGRGQLPFTFRKWQREEGLPQNYVRALAQTRDGYLWVGSDAGVSRFDGLRFVSFGMLEGFQSGPVQTLLGDRDGVLWIGTVGRGLGRWQRGHYTAYTSHDGLPSDTVNTLAEGRDGRLWIGTQSGLAVLQKNHLETFASTGDLAGKPVTALFIDPKGTLWIGAKGAGVFHLDGEKLTQLRDPLFDEVLQDPHCLLVDHEGRLWVGAGDASVLYREGEQWRRYRFPRHLARHYVGALAERPDGTVWAGSVSEGLFQFKHGRLMVVNAGSGLSDNLVEALLVDQEGRLWVGTHAGLNRLIPKTLSVVGYNEGLGNGPVQGLAEVRPGVVWASKTSEGICAWDGRYFHPMPIAGLAPGDPHFGALLVAKDGSCWMGGARGLLHFKDVRAVETEPGESALTGLDVSALAEDGRGRLWAGGRQGQLWCQENGKWFEQTPGRRGAAITAIVAGPGDSVFAGTAGDGLFNVTAAAGGHWEKQAGLLSDWIRTLYADADGTVWIGTGGGGLSRLRGGRISTFTTREGLPDNTVAQILEDNSGHLWIGGDLGIASVNKSDLVAVAGQQSAVVSPQIYGRNEGMVSEECISGFFPIGLKTRAGLLWFPTQEGIVVADPRRQKPAVPAPSVVLEETLVDGVPDRADSLHLSPGKHRLEFRYTGLDFDAPERVRFRYRLNGLDSDWVEAGSSRSASFPYVPYGRYNFEVVAGNGEGGWNKVGASMSVIVEPYLWQTWWFRVPAFLILLAAIAIAARVAEQRKLHQQLEQLEQERVVAQERERIARDLHDDLGSSLARISLLSGLLKADRNNPRQIETHAAKISQSADQTVRSLEEIVWAVRPGSDSLQSLVEYIAHFASEMFDGSEIHCRLDLPHDLPAHPLPPEVRHNVFLVVKEALTNASKHAHPRELLVRAEAANGLLEVSVQDDGRGFDPAKLTRGNGLGNIRRRAQAIGAKIEIESSPGKGTTVKLALPIAVTHANGRTANGG